MTLEVNYRKAKNDTFKSNYKSLKVLCDDHNLHHYTFLLKRISKNNH